MPHGGPHYKIAGTDTEYNGKVIMVAGEPFTTTGQTLEGNSQRLELMEGSAPMNQTQTQDSNPVTRLFTAPSSPRYRRSDNNNLIPIGANLHEHQDGTIMTEHSMGPNDNSVVVNVVSQNGGTTTRTMTQRNQTQRNQTQRTQTSTGGMGGGTPRSGGGGRSGY